MKKSTRLCKENTALFKVLTSRCYYHQQQLMGMLKFLKEEKELCSQTCHNSVRIRSTKPVSSNPKNPLDSQICTNQKPKSIDLNDKRQQLHLPYVSVCLKDLRFTWPNLNLGTVKLNVNKKEDVHLRDEPLYCINTHSKKKQPVSVGCLNSHQSTTQRKLTFSSLSKVKVQRSMPISKSTMIKHDLQYRCTQPGRQLEMTSKCCRAYGDTLDGGDMTVIKNRTFKEAGCGNGKLNKLKCNRKDTPTSSLDSSASSCVNFGSLIKHFLNSETNSFAQLLNQKGNRLKKRVRTRVPKSNEKMSLFDNSSDCQTIDFARKRNLTDTFPMEKNCIKTLQNSVDDGITVSIEEHTRDVLVLKDCKSTKTKSEVQEKITDLPHNTLKIPSTNVNCIRNGQFCLPANKHSDPQRIVNEKRRAEKRRADHDIQLESTISPKRLSRNILGKCKFCDISHGSCSFQDNDNLFCKCTIQKNSGILKNFKAGGVVITRSTNEKNRNAHLKVVVERIEDSKLSANSAVNCKDLCELNLCSGKVKATSVLNVVQKTLKNVKKNDCLNSISVTQANRAGVEATYDSISEAATAVPGNSYFSPIKLMFVSKVESDDGVKYALRSEYTPLNNHRDVALSDKVVKKRKTSHTYNHNSTGRRFCKNGAVISVPDCKSTAQDHPAKLSHCFDQSPFETKTSSSKKRACQVSKNELSSESQRRKCSQKTFTKAGSDVAICFPKNSKSKVHSKMGKSRIAETYIVQNKGSDTQLRIKKVERFLRSSERNLHKHESKSLNFQRISKRPQRRKLSNISSKCNTNSCTSWKRGQDFLSPFQKGIRKCTKKEVNDRADQKTILKQKWTQSSLHIGKLKCSNYNTRSRRLLPTAFGSILSSNFSVRSALYRKSKKLHLAKCELYNKRLRSYQHCKRMDAQCTGITAENCAANIDLQPNTVHKWWSASTSKESLLNDFEKRYEWIANTWLSKNNRGKDNEVQSLSTLKFCTSEMRSPVQMLFRKKCDMGDLAAWFMQTSETQSLSIVRKADAQNSLQKINRKGPKTKKPSINSCPSKHFNKCAPSTPSETLTELFNVSETSTGKCKVGQNPNNLQSMNDQSQDVCVKFACAGEDVVDVTKACTGKVVTATKSSKKIALPEAAALPSPIMHIDWLGSSTKQKMLLQNKTKSKAKDMYVCRSSKQNIQDCKVFITKLSDGSKMSSPYRRSKSVNTIAGNKSKLNPERKLKRSFTTKYCLRRNESLAKSPCALTRIKNSPSKECNLGMCLRNSKRSNAPYDGRYKSPILERRRRLSEITFYVESNSRRSKLQTPKMGKLRSECPKLQLGPIKSVGIPAIGGLSSKDGTYSLTPIRIPMH